MSEAINRIQYGTFSLIACCIFYLIWWSVTFNPMKVFPAPPKYILFVFTFLAGAGGIAFLLSGVRDLPANRGGISNIAVTAAGIIIYFVLLFVSNRLFHRQVTTELALIIAWTVLELCIMNSLYRSGETALNITLLYVIIIIAAAVIGMLCYLAYYNLEDKTAFYTGMVPLILFAVIMALQLPVIRSCF